VNYHLGMGFDQGKPNELIVIDEADTFMFTDPVRFNKFLGKSFVLCLTATPDNFDPAGPEILTISALQFKKYYYVLEGA
jgi:hypothetical protein